jgi:DNA repair exonuclease SbcCD ATPase subunit
LEGKVKIPDSESELLTDVYFFAMDEPSSDAAVAAIRALQDRIKELEQDRETLQCEVDSLKIQAENHARDYRAREQELIDATNRAQDMIDQATPTMREISQARAEHQAILDEMAAIENRLHSTDDGDSDSVVERLKAVNSSKSNVADYQLLLRDIFTSTSFPVASRILSSPEIQKIPLDPDLLPHPLRDVVERLAALPTEFRRQPVPTKRAIFQGLICSIEMSFDLANKIRAFERQKFKSTTPRRIGIDIHNLAVQLYVLEYYVKRFSF